MPACYSGRPPLWEGAPFMPYAMRRIYGSELLGAATDPATVKNTVPPEQLSYIALVNPGPVCLIRRHHSNSVTCAHHVIEAFFHRESRAKQAQST
jgi:hypothetical protein